MAFRSVTKSRPCPICGKPDWCGWKLFDNGDEQLVCQRDTDAVNTCGLDGNFYIFIKISEAGNSMFQELNQYMRWRDNCKKEHNFAQAKSQTAHQERPKTVLDEVRCKSHKELDKIYRSILTDLILEDYHRDYLLKEGWSRDLMEKNLIRSFPEKDFSRCRYKNFFSKSLYRKRLAAKQIERFGENALLGVPGAYKDKGGNWTFAGPKGILFPLYDIDGYIYGLRIRMDYMDVGAALQKNSSGDDWFEDSYGTKHYLVPLKGTYTIQEDKIVWDDPDDKKGKYRPFHSYYMDEEMYKQGFIKNCYDSGCAAEEQIGIYMDQERDHSRLCYLTEGEKKGIYANNVLRTPFISFPGVTHWAKLLKGKKGERIIDRLKQRGVEMFIVAYDADKAVNEKVLQQQNNIVEALKKEGFFMATAEWDMCLGKGIDDLLAAGHKPGFQLV